MSKLLTIVENKKILAVFALVAALAGTALIYQSQKVRWREYQSTVPVIVAQQDIPAGARLAREQLAQQDIPRKYQIPGTIPPADLASVLDQRVTVAIKRGQPLYWSHIQLEAGASGLAKMLTPGERALTISADQLSTMEGLLRPADRVDVLCTFSLPSEKGGNRQATKTLMQNVTVLAVGGRLPGEGGGRDFSSVTLKVNLAEAELLTFAEGCGKLRFIVRPGQDQQIQEEPPEVDFKNIFSIGRNLTEQKKQGQKQTTAKLTYD